MLEKIPIEARCDEMCLQHDSPRLLNVSAETLAKGWGSLKILNLPLLDPFVLDAAHWEALFKEILDQKRMESIDVPYRASRLVPKELWQRVVKVVADVNLDGFSVH